MTSKKRAATPKQRPARGAAVTFSSLEMHPFTYTAEGTDEALELAAIGAHPDESKANLALIDLIGGIAAIEEAEDRYYAAFEVCAHLFTFTPEAQTALRAASKRFRQQYGK